MSGFDIGAVGLRTRVSCPFNPAHVMNFSKFHSHIVKCQKQHPEDKRKPCPYNFSEFIEPEKMAEHMDVCPYRQDYGSRKWTADDSINKRYVKPCDVDFGYVEEESNNIGGFGEDGSDEDADDQIDSVSVLSQKYGSSRRNLAWSTSTQSVDKCGQSTADSSSCQTINVGRGRAAYFARRGIPIASQSDTGKDSSASKASVQASVQASDYDGEFSFLREANIRPKPVGHDEGFSILREANIHPKPAEVTESSRATVNDDDEDDDRIAYLEKLRAEVEKKHFPRGRGRGILFQRR